MSTPPQVFIDTNVWFSAFYGSNNAEKIIKAHIENNIEGVISQQVLKELIKNIGEKIPSAIKPLQTLLNSAPPIILKNPTKISPVVKNNVELKDQIIFQSVVETKIPIFVTGNLKDFNVSKIRDIFSIKILSPKELVEYLDLK